MQPHRIKDLFDDECKSLNLSGLFLEENEEEKPDSTPVDVTVSFSKYIYVLCKTKTGLIWCYQCEHVFSLPNDI